MNQNTTDRRRGLSVRGLMLAVAVVAVGFGAYTSRHYGARRAYFLKRAEAYASKRVEFDGRAVEARQKASAYLRLAEGVEGEPADKNRKWAEDELLRATLYRRVAEFDARMEARYRGAAERPWAPPPAEMSSPVRGFD